MKIVERDFASKHRGVLSRDCFNEVERIYMQNDLLGEPRVEVGGRTTVDYIIHLTYALAKENNVRSSSTGP